MLVASRIQAGPKSTAQSVTHHSHTKLGGLAPLRPNGHLVCPGQSVPQFGHAVMLHDASSCFVLPSDVLLNLMKWTMLKMITQKFAEPTVYMVYPSVTSEKTSSLSIYFLRVSGTTVLLFKRAHLPFASKPLHHFPPGVLEWCGSAES